jgi:hypothetical protein
MPSDVHEGPNFGRGFRTGKDQDQGVIQIHGGRRGPQVRFQALHHVPDQSIGARIQGGQMLCERLCAQGADRASGNARGSRFSDHHGRAPPDQPQRCPAKRAGKVVAGSGRCCAQQKASAVDPVGTEAASACSRACAAGEPHRRAVVSFQADRAGVVCGRREKGLEPEHVSQFAKKKVVTARIRGCARSRCEKEVECPG